MLSQSRQKWKKKFLKPPGPPVPRSTSPTVHFDLVFRLNFKTSFFPQKTFWVFRVIDTIKKKPWQV